MILTKSVEILMSIIDDENGFRHGRVILSNLTSYMILELFINNDIEDVLIAFHECINDLNTENSGKTNYRYLKGITINTLKDDQIRILFEMRGKAGKKNKYYISKNTRFRIYHKYLSNHYYGVELKLGKNNSVLDKQNFLTRLQNIKKVKMSEMELTE